MSSKTPKVIKKPRFLVLFFHAISGFMVHKCESLKYLVSGSFDDKMATFFDFQLS